MWISFTFAMCIIAMVTAEKIFMSDAELNEYKVTLPADNNEIQWQIDLFDYVEEDGFEFAVRVPQDGVYSECVRKSTASDWECNAVWTNLPALDYYAGISKVENNVTSSNAGNERQIVILGKVENGQLIRSSGWHISWPAAGLKKKGLLGQFGQQTVIKVIENWKNWPIYYWIAVAAVVALLFTVCLSCCVCCCRR